jgi:hypothetical protein
LLELEEIALGKNNAWGSHAAKLIANDVRDARHDTIDVMRADLGLTNSARPPDDFNPFVGTNFETRYAERYGRKTAEVSRMDVQT